MGTLTEVHFQAVQKNKKDFFKKASKKVILVAYALRGHFSLPRAA